MIVFLQHLTLILKHLAYAVGHVALLVIAVHIVTFFSQLLHKQLTKKDVQTTTSVTSTTVVSAA